MIRDLLLSALILSFAGAGPSNVLAADAEPDAGLATARAAVQKRFPTVPIDGLRATPLPGLYEFTVGIDVFYISADARFLLRGDLMDFASDRNLSEERRAELRKARLDAVPDSESIVFGPKTAKYTVTVFTDIDCGFCRRLHQGIADLNARGVRVRYLFFPRAGLGSESWQKAQNVWCAKDRARALTDAKAGRDVPHGECAATPIARHYQLGESFRLDGTPLVITQDGYVIGGYLPPDDMVRQLDQLAQRRDRG